MIGTITAPLEDDGSDEFVFILITRILNLAKEYGIDIEVSDDTSVTVEYNVKSLDWYNSSPTVVSM